MNEPQREQEVRLAEDGDLDALQRLIVLYHPSLRTSVDRQIDVAMSRHLDADDVLQDAYVAAFKDLPKASFDGPASFYRWVETIAQNKLKNRFRSMKQQKRDIRREVDYGTFVSTLAPGLADQFAAAQDTPSRHARKAEVSVAVLSCLARLTEDQRRVIMLQVFENLPTSNIAELPGKSEMAVYALLHRGLKSMRQHLNSITRFLTRL